MKSKNRVLAIDYGTKVTGLAKFCEGEDFRPHAFGRIITQQVDLISELLSFIEEYEIKTIVIGLPTMPDGQPSQQGVLVEEFVKNLKAN